jgi:TrmH family RNA methyltransferase
MFAQLAVKFNQIHEVHTLITSHHNPKIKGLLALEKPRERRRQCLFVIEGKKEIALAIKAGYRIGNLFFCESMIRPEDVLDLGIPEKFLFPITKEVYDKIAVRENSGGLMAVAEQKTHRLSDLRVAANPLVVVLESVEKPGNLGAILRTADAAGVNAVIVCDPQTDIYNPNVIRSSIGCIFTVPVAIASSAEAIAWLRERDIRIYSAALQDAKPYHTQDLTQPCAIVMGTEATGLTEIWTSQSHANIIIPMAGIADSMNVSTAAAVLIFEARRQRGFARL